MITKTLFHYLILSIFTSLNCENIYSQTKPLESFDEIREYLRRSRTTTQVKEIKKTISDLIYYSPLLIGKTEYQLISKGKPAQLDEDIFLWNPEWQDASQNANREKKLNLLFKNSVRFTLSFSSENRSYVGRLFPNHWLSMDEIVTFINENYKMKEDGWSYPVPIYRELRLYDPSIPDKAVFKMTVEDNTPILYIYCINSDGKILFLE